MATIMNTCDRCGSAVAAGASVCPNCGAPQGGVDASVSGVPAETIRTDFSGAENRFGERQTPLGTQMPLGGEQSLKPEPASWQEAQPPAALMPSSSLPSQPAQQIFDAPQAPAAPSRRFPWPWIIGCCLALVLLACLVVIAFGGWFMGNFST